MIAGMVACVSTSAFAEVKASAQSGISGITFTVQDLTPTDGHAAGYVMGDRMTYYSVNNRDSWPGTISVWPAWPTPVDWSLDSTLGFAALEGNGGLGSYTSSVSANTRTADAYYYDLEAVGADWQTIVLKAGTALTLTGFMAGSIDQYVPAIMDGGEFRTHASVGLWTGGSLQSFGRELQLTNGSTHGSYSDEFSLYAENSSTEDIVLRLQIAAYSKYSGWDSTPIEPGTTPPIPSPVPEPGTWLMLSVGAMALGARAWRKRRT